MLNIPNSLTLFRVALIPVFVVVFFLPFHWSGPVSAGIFALASITDWLDGYLARRLKQSSPFGAFLDPVADKLIVVVALVLLVSAHPYWWVAIAAAIIVGREITISGLREWMAEMGARQRVAVSTVAKYKTAGQMAAITIMLYRIPLAGFPVYLIGLALLFVSAALTLWTMAWYLHAAWPQMRSRG
jgi:CDP-diacylglycerol--glycerol-3-phosphate 3-phosphatidyltransferase